MDSGDFTKCLDEFMKTNEAMVTLLKEWIEWIQGHQTRTNVARTVGTTVSVAGTLITVGAIVAAPFTGGTSVIAVGGAGAITALCGGVGNITTEAVDTAASKWAQGRIEVVIATRDEQLKKLDKYLRKLQKFATRVEESGDYSEADAIAIAIAGLVRKGLHVRDAYSKTQEIKRLGKLVLQGRSAANIALRNGGLVMKGVRLQAEALKSALAFFGFNIAKKTAMNVARSAAAVFGGVFIFLDVKFLIDNLSSDHPLEKSVKDIIAQIEAELEQIRTIRKFCDEVTAIESDNDEDG